MRGPMSTITDSIGRVLAGRYRIEALLGTGASAHVLAAWDVTLRRRVAIKVLHPGLAGDTGFLRRFRAEAQAAAALSHPRIVSVYDWGEDEEGPFLVLEYLGGGSLRDLLDTGYRFGPSQAARAGMEAAQGLAYAHARGFVHRDIKPANLLFDDEGGLRIADFGLARALAEAAWTEPVGALLGTARYAAPEQAEGRSVEGRADVYSLALVLYEAITGEVPFLADTMLGTLKSRVGAPLPEHEGLGPLAGTLRDAAAPDPAERLDAAALGDRLAGIAKELPSPDPIPRSTRPSPDAAGRGAAGVDRTELGLGAAASQDVPGAGAAPGGLYGAEAPRPVGDDRRHSMRLGNGEPGRRNGRRLVVIATVFAIVALLAAGGTYGAERFKVFTPTSTVPQLAGVSISRAAGLARRDHLLVRSIRSRFDVAVPAGRVIREIPGHGTHLKQGSVVQLVVSKGPPPEQIPSLGGMTCTGATNALLATHLRALCVDAYSATVPAGQVISWTPQGSMTEGGTVTVTVSKGPPMVRVPDITGDGVGAAVRAIEAAGLNPGSVYGPAGGMVFHTYPAMGQWIPEHSTVDIYTQ